MTQLERQIRTTQHRLWMNRWLEYLTGCLAAAAGAFAAAVLVQRLYDFPWPVLLIGGGLAFAALVVSTILTVLRRESAALAATKLDDAAGLRERISSGHYCKAVEDPFAQAVVADAERISGALSARQHIRFTVPRSLAASLGTIVVAALTFLITPGWLRKTEANESPRAQVEQAKVAVKRNMDQVRQLVETTPALQDLKDKIGDEDKDPAGKLEKATDVRHEAVRKIDNLADAVKEKRESEKYESVREVRKMLRGIKEPNPADAMTQPLAKALSQGDFKTAKEEVNALKEQLATLKSEEDKEMVEKLGKQLDNLAKQLEQVADDKKLKQQLEQAGIKKEDIERMVENLKKNDLDQLKKQLEEKGMSQQQIQKLADQLQQKQQAGSMAQKMSQAMQQASQSASAGQTGEALAGLSQAAQQLSELEQMEQEMNQLDSTLAELQNAKNDLDKPCSSCKGTGQMNGKPCSHCNGSGDGQPGDGPGQSPGNGGGMGPMGQGRGNLAPQQQTAVSFKTERAKVHTGKGAIIGQILVEDEQVKGEVQSDFVKVVSAAERDASDLINRDRIPRQYQKSVRAYFSRNGRSSAQSPPAGENGEEKKVDGETQEQKEKE